MLQNAGDDWRDVLGAHLAQQLPDYMVPAQWVVLDQMPLSPNGKLDRKALPRPDAVQHAQAYLAPQSPLEKQLAAIWRDVLGVEQVGLRDNFFELGGHSLLILMLKERIKNACGTNLSVTQLMLNPTVQGQVDCLLGSARRSLIVPLNSVESGTPLFLFHPSYGSVHCYKAVALALREQRPVLGVICRALTEEGGTVPAWATMVEDYTEQLLVAHPQGAFRLAGWSLGGNLALDVAYRLEQAGREVECVGLVDTPPPHDVTAFWKEDDNADDRHLSDVEQRAELLGVMFPAQALQIQTAWQEAQACEQDQVRQWARLDAWAEHTLGEAYLTLKRELLEGSEAQVSWDVKRELDQRLQEARYSAITAPVLCWWAAQSKGGQHRELIESSLRAVLGQMAIEQSVVIDTTHERIVDNAEFVSSFLDVMGR